VVFLSKKRTGMGINLGGSLKSSSSFGRTELKKHIEIMGIEYYKGNTAIVDQFLQLYCVAEKERIDVEFNYESPELKVTGLEIENTHLKNECDELRALVEKAVSYGWDCGHYGNPCDANDFIKKYNKESK
jgi:hypothetical protein